MDAIHSLLGENLDPELDALAGEELEKLDAEITKNSMPSVPNDPIVQPEPDEVQPERDDVQEEPNRSETPREEVPVLAA